MAFVGIGEMDESAPLFLDHFLTAEELAAARGAGAVGEIVGWIFDARGPADPWRRQRAHRQRADPRPRPGDGDRPRQGTAQAARIAAALRGRLVNGLITDEATAEALLGEA